MMADTTPSEPSADLCIHPVLDIQKVFFLHPADPMAAIMNFALPLEVVSQVNIAALQRVFQDLIERHDALRLTFIRQDGELFQKARVHPRLDFAVMDASQWSVEKLKQCLLAMAQQPFDLEQDALLRVRMFQQANSHFILLLVVHQIVIDGEAIFLLLEELRTLYQAYTTGEAASLPPSSTSFLNYVDWYRPRLQGAKGEKLWQYWQEKLGGELPVLNLPTDYPRPPVRSQHGASYSFLIPQDLTHSLRNFAQATKGTLYTTLLAAYYVLLHVYTGDKDIIVTTTASLRTHKDFVRTIGCIANPIASRASWSGDPSFQDLLAIVYADVSMASWHREYPFDLLVERLVDKKDPSRPLISQTSFLYLRPSANFKESVELFNPESTKTVNFGGLTLKRLSDVPLEIVSWRDVLFNLIECEDYVSGHCEYDTTLFKEATIIQMVARYLALLEIIVTTPQIRLSEITTYLMNKVYR